MIRAIMAASALAFSVGAFAAEPTTTTTAPAAPAEPAAAAPAPAKAAGKTKEECVKEGHKKGKELKKCMAGK